MTLGQELEDAVEGLRGSGHVQGYRALPGEHQRAPGRLLQLVEALAPGGPAEVEGLPVVVRQELGVVGDALDGQALDPSGRHDMLVDPGEPGDLAVGDVADQGVRERVLRVALHGGDPGGPDELALGQVPEAGLDALHSPNPTPRLPL